MTSSEVIVRVDATIRRELGRSYKKNDERLFADLLGHLEKAEANAEQLLEWHGKQDSVSSSQMNPATRLHEITRMLSEYIEIR